MERLEHWLATQEALDHALGVAPLYAKRGLPPRSDAPPAEDVRRRLAALRPLAKLDLRTQFPRGFADRDALRAALERGEVEVVGTSGTTADRVEVLWDRGWWDRQERAAMRLSRFVGQVMDEALAGGGYREAVLTTPVCGATCHIGELSMAERTEGGVLFLNQTPDPSLFTLAELDRMLDELDAFAPHGLEADPAYLAALCRHARRRGRLPRPGRFVTLTYELASRLHLRELRRALPETPLLPLYGSTETGVLFMTCDEGQLHQSEAFSHVELLPLARAQVGHAPRGGALLARVLVTTIGRHWMPLVRYDLGDLVELAAGACRCGEPGLALRRVEGRSADLLDDATGRLLTPSQVDDALAVVAGLAAYQLTQEGAGRYLLRFVADGEMPREGSALPAALAAVARRLLGEEADVTLSRESAILPEPSGKYRLTRRFQSLPIAELFPADEGATMADREVEAAS